MKNQLHVIGFGFILFGMLLALLCMTGSGIFSSFVSPFLPWLGLLSGIIGLVLLFDRSHKE